MEEGSDSKADLYITADAGRLGAFDAKGMLQSGLNTDVIKSAVPKNFRTSKWTGIAKRARIMYYSPERVNANELNGMTYEGLADSKWKGRVVIRKSNNIYNQSLVASLVKNIGKKETCSWAKGVVANMARDSKGNDRAQILAVADAFDAMTTNRIYRARKSVKEAIEEIKAQSKRSCGCSG